MRRITTRWRENEREESDELFALSLLRGEFFFSKKKECLHGTALDLIGLTVRQRKWTSTWQLVGAFRGRMVLAGVQCWEVVVPIGAD